jgi:hypothetical protein
MNSKDYSRLNFGVTKHSDLNTDFPKPRHLRAELIESEDLSSFKDAKAVKYALRIELKSLKISLPFKLVYTIGSSSPTLLYVDLNDPERIFKRYSAACNIISISKSDLSAACERVALALCKEGENSFSENECLAFIFLRIFEFINLSELCTPDKAFISCPTDLANAVSLAVSLCKSHKPTVIINGENVDTSPYRDVLFIDQSSFELYIKNKINKENFYD